MGGGDAGSDNGDVRQRGEVRHGESARVKPWSKLAIGDSRANGDSWTGGVRDIERYRFEMCERDLAAGGVGDGVEGVARAEGLRVAQHGKELLEFLDGCRLQD